MVFGTLDPLSAVSSSVNVTIKILEVTYQLKAVGEQTADLLSTTRHVDFMVHEAHRLRRLKNSQLSASERIMIDTIISDTEEALRGVARLVEPCRVDKDTRGGIRFGHRVMWVFRDNPSVRDKHQKLQVCHQSLTVAFNCLYSKDVVVIAPAPDGKSEEQPPPPAPPPPYDPQLIELLGWQKRRKGRKSLGEKESDLNENTSMLNTESTAVSVGGSRSPSPCLLAIPLDDDSDAASLSSFFSKTTLHSPDMAAPEIQPSALYQSNSPFSIATTSSKADSLSPNTSASESYLHPHDQTTPFISHTGVCNDPISPKPNLPELDSPQLATMIAPYTITDKTNRNLQVGDEQLRRPPLSTSDQKFSSLATASKTAPSNPSFSPPPLSPAPTELPTSSTFGAGYGLGLSWLNSTRHQSYNDQEPTATSTLDQLPLAARTNSDSQLGGTHRSDDTFDAMTRADDVGIRENRAKSVGQGVLRKGGRSWLAYHATRSEMGNDWNG